MSKNTAQLRSSVIKKDRHCKDRKKLKPKLSAWAKLKFLGSVVAVVRSLNWTFDTVSWLWNTIKDFFE